MGYYIRVLGEKDVPISIGALRACLPVSSGIDINEEASDETGWSQLILRHSGGPDTAVVERNPVVPGELGAEEIGGFVDEVQDAQPASASKWLAEYLPSLAVIYAFQLLSGTEVKDGWSAVRALQSYIWNQVGGILQADMEGFSNEQGHHILWQFSEGVEGKWSMAVLDHDGKWVAFTMDLGDPEHRRAFLDGRVPAGVTGKTES
jgi:hypothetical protein